MHELLFGYLAAAVAGFLLTAIPNWTGRLPVIGAPLLALWLLWLAGRLAMLGVFGLPPLGVAVVDVAFGVALTAVAAREIVVGKVWRNLPVAALAALMAAANALFHLEALDAAAFAPGSSALLHVSAGLWMLAFGGLVALFVPILTRPKR